VPWWGLKISRSPAAKKPGFLYWIWWFPIALEHRAFSHGHYCLMSLVLSRTSKKNCPCCFNGIWKGIGPRWDFLMVSTHKAGLSFKAWHSMVEGCPFPVAWPWQVISVKWEEWIISLLSQHLLSQGGVSYVRYKPEDCSAAPPPWSSYLPFLQHKGLAQGLPGVSEHFTLGGHKSELL
jgi:hypothetical protein